MMKGIETATRAVITVGDGRGFIVRGKWGRLIITAAHCLPHFPPCHGASYLEERTYPDLLAPLGSEPAVWAECLFVDPIADVAILGPPDGQELGDQCEAYERLVDPAEVLEISEPKQKCQALLLSLEDTWFECTVQHQRSGPLCISNAAQGIVGGMSGSPIIAKNGTAIGVVCLSGGTDKVHTGGPNPRLMGSLPGWYLEFLAREPATPTMLRDLGE
jgi:hypothetical protein